MDCFDNIIGLSRTSCPYFSQDFNALAAESTSGLFLGETEHSAPLSALKESRECCEDLQETLARARENAILDFKRNLYMELGSRYTTRAASYRGPVGSASGSGLLNISYPLAGVVLDCSGRSGATITVESIQPFFNFDGTLVVSIYEAVNAGARYQVLSKIRDVEIQTSIATPTPTPIPGMELPTRRDGQPLSYLFLYEKQSGIAPRDNASSCGCGGKETTLHAFLRPYGISGNSLETLVLTNRNQHINGLLVYADVRCGDGAFLCENYSANEFIRLAVSHAILYRTEYNVIQSILNSTVINRATMVNREQMQHNAYVLDGKFQKSTKWLGENMDLSGNDCYVCNSGSSGPGGVSYSKTGILQ